MSNVPQNIPAPPSGNATTEVFIPAAPGSGVLTTPGVSSTQPDNSSDEGN
jgi:hypothetical protein